MIRQRTLGSLRFSSMLLRIVAPSLMLGIVMAATEARFVLLVLITYREQWAREQDQHRHGEENQNVVVYTFASICQRVLPRPHCSPWKARFTIVRVPPCEIFRLYLAKTQPVVHLRITTRIARMLRHRISLSLFLSLCLHLCEPNRIFIPSQFLSSR